MNKINNIDTTEQMLKKLSVLWKNRAAVNQTLSDYTELEFDITKDDFSSSLLPFRNHPAWLELSEEKRSKCLSYAWAIYNLKTIYIECDVVTPACEDIIKTPPHSNNQKILQDVMSQALLDEALHTRMSILACNYIYDKRQLEALVFNDFNLVSWRQKLLSNCSAEWEKRLTRFAIACASETLITDYLKTMAEDNLIQPICHEVTRTHAADEWSHSSVFSLVATDIVQNLRDSEKKYFKNIIERTVEMFANNELGAWAKVFKMLDIPYAEDILNETEDSNEIEIYTGSVENLINRIGLSNQ